MAAVKWLAAMLLGVVAAGCALLPSPPPRIVGNELGRVAYPVDKAQEQAGNAVYTGARIRPFVATVRDVYHEAALADAITKLDPENNVVLAFYFNACTKDRPQLQLERDVLTGTFAEEIERACVRPKDTLAVFAVRRSDLPAQATIRLCNLQARLIGMDVTTSGEAGMC